MAKDYRSLGRFHLDGIPPSPSEIPQIEVVIDIDANSIMSITAKDKGTGKENKIRIVGGGQLSKEEIEKMKEEALANAENDQKERDTVDKLNNVDSLIFQTEKQIKEFSYKLTDEDKSSINVDFESFKEAYNAQDVDNIDSASNNLNDTWAKMSTRLYKQSSEKPKQPESDNTDNIEDVNNEKVN